MPVLPPVDKLHHRDVPSDATWRRAWTYVVETIVDAIVPGTVVVVLTVLLYDTTAATLSAVEERPTPG